LATGNSTNDCELKKNQGSLIKNLLECKSGVTKQEMRLDMLKGIRMKGTGKVSQKKRGFTLIELLVVVSIIALLVSILMPALSKARQQAQAVICVSNMRQWGLIYSMYTMSNNGYFSDGLNKEGLWIDALRPYYENVHEIRSCPRVKRFATDLGLEWYECQPTQTGSVFIGWGRENVYEDTENEDFYYYGSYGQNFWLYNEPEAILPDEWKWYQGFTENKKFYKNMQKIEDPEQVPVFFECTWRDSLPTEFTVPPRDDIGRLGGSGHIINRHNGYTMMLFADLSARKVGLRGLWDFKWYKGYQPSKSPWARKGKDDANRWPSWLLDMPE
jgi:prepilin-type N-terminal cleavage/methylation domain-containing protein/prepilin-type processing-associated H-X9-DG protein